MRKVWSGVPKRSVLGPVLIFINDIDSGLSSSVLKFADDDTKVFSLIDSYVIDGCWTNLVDLVGTNMLVELADEISDTVADLFNKSLITGEVPPNWKLANVTPIFKKGKKSSVSNYRPVIV